MREINYKKRKVKFVSIEDVNRLKDFKESFSILIESNDDFSDEINKILNNIIRRECKEICCVGIKADELHDYIDDRIEEKEFFHIITTSLTDDSNDEILNYFLNFSGGKPNTLFVHCENKELLTMLEERVSN